MTWWRKEWDSDPVERSGPKGQVAGYPSIGHEPDGSNRGSNGTYVSLRG
jgi:hypothetical protein